MRRHMATLLWLASLTMAREESLISGVRRSPEGISIDLGFMATVLSNRAQDDFKEWKCEACRRRWFSFPVCIGCYTFDIMVYICDGNSFFPKVTALHTVAIGNRPVELAVF